METIKQQFITRFNTFFTLGMCSLISLFLLTIRMKLTGSFFFLFLVWNLFLAAVPFIITFYLKSKKVHNKYIFWLQIVAWLLFLPNAPYIVTDAVHLQHSESKLLDYFLVASFAITGLIFYFVSVADFKEIMAKKLSKLILTTITISLHFLVGFGIYLGRVLRFNSWDIIKNPIILAEQVVQILAKPQNHSTVWIITITFGMGLFILEKCLKYFNKRKHKITFGKNLL